MPSYLRDLWLALLSEDIIWHLISQSGMVETKHLPTYHLTQGEARAGEHEHGLPHILYVVYWLTFSITNYPVPIYALLINLWWAAQLPSNIVQQMPTGCEPPVVVNKPPPVCSPPCLWHLTLEPSPSPFTYSTYALAMSAHLGIPKHMERGMCNARRKHHASNVLMSDMPGRVALQPLRPCPRGLAHHHSSEQTARGLSRPLAGTPPSTLSTVGPPLVQGLWEVPRSST